MKSFVLETANKEKVSRTEKEDADIKELVNFSKNHPIIAIMLFTWVGLFIGAIGVSTPEYSYLRNIGHLLKFYASYQLADYVLKKLLNITNTFALALSSIIIFALITGLGVIFLYPLFL